MKMMSIFVLTLMGFLYSIPSFSQVASYPFEGNANDIIAGNNAIVIGATLASDRNEQPNSAYLFDGIDDYMEVVNPTPFNFGTGEFAVSFWMKPLNENGDRQMIFQKGDSGGAIPQYWLRLNDGPGVDIRALWGNGNPPSAILDITDSPILFDGEWHHIVFQRTSQRNELYVDCMLIGTNDDINRDVSSSGGLLIGAQSPLPGTNLVLNHFSGLIDDLIFFDESIDLSSIGDFCAVTEASPPIGQIPTLGQWSLILLSFFILIVGVSGIKKLINREDLFMP